MRETLLFQQNNGKCDVSINVNFENGIDNIGRYLLRTDAFSADISYRPQPQQSSLHHKDKFSKNGILERSRNLTAKAAL